MSETEKPTAGRCGAKTRSGRPCRSATVPGRKRCRLHGGKSPAAGPDHPAWKTGRYSSAVPKGIRKLVEAAANDSELMSLREEIALVQAAIVEALGRVEEDGARSSKWGEVADLTERKARLVLAEHKRAVELEQMIPASRLFAMIEFVVGVVRDVVKDRTLVVEIGNRLRTVFDAPADSTANGHVNRLR